MLNFLVYFPIIFIFCRCCARRHLFRGRRSRHGSSEGDPSDRGPPHPGIKELFTAIVSKILALGAEFSTVFFSHFWEILISSGS